MSEEIQKLCEAYINRPFDDEDVQNLRVFLRDLQKQKVVRPKAEIVPKKIVSKQELPKISSPRYTGPDEKPSYVRDKEVEDYSDKVAERIYEAKQAAVAVKDRLGDWKKKSR